MPPDHSGRRVAVRLVDLDCSYRVRVQDEDSKLYRTLRFGGRSTTEVQAVRGVTVDIYEGEVFGIIGHNGAGKTTLMRAIAGVLLPSGGQVLVRSQPQRIDVSWALNKQLTGRENIRLGLFGLGFSPVEVSEMTPRVVEFADIGEFIDLPLGTYSSGMRQRLGFSIATESSPAILLMDEALAVGDRDFRDRSVRRVEELQARAGTIVLASHNLSMVRTTCDRVLWMRDGQAEALGSPEEVVEKYEAGVGAERNTLRQQRREARRIRRRKERLELLELRRREEERSAYESQHRRQGDE